MRFAACPVNALACPYTILLGMNIYRHTVSTGFVKVLCRYYTLRAN